MSLLGAGRGIPLPVLRDRGFDRGDVFPVRDETQGSRPLMQAFGTVASLLTECLLAHATPGKVCQARSPQSLTIHHRSFLRFGVTNEGTDTDQTQCVRFGRLRKKAAQKRK